MSKSTAAPFFSFAECSLNSSTEVPRMNFVPLLSMCFFMMEPARTSRIDGRIRSAISTTVMSALYSLSASAAFSPISPAPIISTFIPGLTSALIAFKDAVAF